MNLKRILLSFSLILLSVLLIAGCATETGEETTTEGETNTEVGTEESPATEVEAPEGDEVAETGTDTSSINFDNPTFPDDFPDYLLYPDNYTSVIVADITDQEKEGFIQYNVLLEIAGGDLDTFHEMTEEHMDFLESNGYQHVIGEPLARLTLVNYRKGEEDVTLQITYQEVEESVKWSLTVLTPQ